MENMNFTEPDRLSFRNKVVVILAISKKVERLNALPTDASFAFNSNDMFPVEVIMKKPNPPNKSFPNFINFCSFRNVKYQIKQHKIWNLCQTFDKEFSNNIPTWGAFNSLLNPVPEISICQSLPLYPSPLTDWSTLYAALKIVQGINIAVTKKNKTIVSLDLQLHSKCMQIIENPDICNNYIFRLGELHIVFAMIKILGKYIENSGLDRLFIETGIYGETT